MLMIIICDSLVLDHHHQHQPQQQQHLLVHMQIADLFIVNCKRAKSFTQPLHRQRHPSTRILVHIRSTLE